jgi:hypothetical protein
MKMMIINYANAVKLSGDKERGEKILDSEDWSAVTDNFKICVAAVKDDMDTVLELMHPVVTMGLMGTGDFREWPVFDSMRSDPKFISSFEEQFGEKMFPGSRQRGGSASKSLTSDTTESEPEETLH